MASLYVAGAVSWCGPASNCTNCKVYEAKFGCIGVGRGGIFGNPCILWGSFVVGLEGDKRG